ncbi:hypothetical protein J7T55_003238 [Diaporthe amygdali]|uniref:uncharacterized protein n=1 Tax=Phomopsis amygdali TaxID=1214568 RepID=UPI0022FE2C80|nr:uncharacterized protein J7T55_003238 [Diaporthe amygdali]KAJ0122722.1 hypothetical protein J7T55_003238 [Diaporthe amygdali]
MIIENHDLQVRFKWRNENDIAIWDNRSMFHTATYDYDDDKTLGERVGIRTVGIGEAPYFDPDSISSALLTMLMPLELFYVLSQATVKLRLLNLANSG